MAVDERERHELHRRLDEVLGADVATNLMRHLPPSGWGDVATKQDLDHLGTQLRLEMATLRGELHREIADVGGEVQGLRAEMHRELRDLNHSLSRTYLAGNIAVMVAMLGVMLTAIRWL